MIDINLIPPALRKDGKEGSSPAINIPHDVLIGVGSGLIFLLLTVHLLLGGVWFIGFGHLAMCQAKWQKLSADKKGLDDINVESKELKKKIKIISDLTIPKIILWAPKFNAISDALPRGLWIRKMSLDKSDLVVEGSVVSKTENEINNVGSFLNALKQKEEFMKDFSTLEVNSIQRGKNHTVDVTDFTVMAKVK